MTDPSAPAPVRAHGSDRLERADERERVLLCEVEKAWSPRRDRTLTQAEHPGTAVSWDGVLFEVRAAEPAAEGAVRYRLAPWPDAHAIRRMEHYDEASEAARGASRSDLRRRVAARRLSIALAPLGGLLPGRVQERMESELGAPALAMTISSAAPLFVVGLLGVLERFVGGLGGGFGFPRWLAPPAPVAVYLFVESALRLASAAAALQPMGSLPVVVAWEAVAAMRRGSGSGSGNGGVPPRSAAADAWPDEDRFRMLEPFLALLSPEEQSRLEERFAFRPLRWGRITAGILLAVCGSNVLAALVAAAARRFSVADALWLLGGTPLAIEQAARWRRLASGRPAGSVLGALVRPLARPLLRG
jgi:hypothetical protein